MPADHFFAGACARHYPASRDASDLPIGDAAPGDIRPLNEPLDSDWLPVEGNETLLEAIRAAIQAERPAKSAPKSEWQEYAERTGLAAGGDAEKLTKAELQELSIPPETGRENAKGKPGGGKPDTDTKAGAAGKEG